MAYKFTYLTVQHSGTRYLESYFVYLGFTPLRQSNEKTFKFQKPIPNPGEIEFMWRHYRGCLIGPQQEFSELTVVKVGFPIVSTLRHPLKTAMSYLTRGYDLNDCVERWNNFIKISTQRPIILYDTDCPEHKKTQHLLNIIHAVDCYKDEHEELTDNFVRDWPVIGEYNSEHKEGYLQDGTLPDVYDWKRFDRAVNWYNKVIEQCVY